MFVEELEEQTMHQMGTDVVELESSISRLKTSGSELLSVVEQDERMCKYVIIKQPELLGEELLTKLLFSADKLLEYKSAELLTRLYEHKEHRKEYLSFFRRMLKEDTSYDEMNQLLVFMTDFLSCRSTGAFDVEQRKIEIVMNKVIMELLSTFVFVKDVQYNTLLVIYVLSFSEECMRHMDPLVNDVIVLIKEKPREKVLRLCYGILVNALGHGHLFSPCKISDISRCTDAFLKSNYGDVELVGDLARVHSEVQKLSKSFCVKNYLSELFESKLEDSEYHHDEEFWADNIELLMEKKVDVVKALKKYLKSHRPGWVCLACNDIYFLVKAAPEITELLTKFQVKEVLINLIDSENDDIKFHAIQALNMCIFSEWH
jgi:V-type H+-transporting ATPase subunit H